MDIATSLKNKIIQIQAPTKGGAVLPAKGYHLITGATLGCDVKKAHRNSVILSQLHSQFIELYRHISLCSKASKYAFKEALDKNEKSPRTLAILHYLKNYWQWSVEQGQDKLNCNDEKKLAMMFIDSIIRQTFSGTLVHSLRSEPYCKEQDKKLCDDVIREYEALSIDIQWTISQHLAGFRFGYEVCHP